MHGFQPNSLTPKFCFLVWFFLLQTAINVTFLSSVAMSDKFRKLLPIILVPSQLFELAGVVLSYQCQDNVDILSAVSSAASGCNKYQTMLLYAK